ncbi:MAG: T9SS type A sorting domain-containing protein [Chitinophagaceae bacterium]|nr:MAG: T9SS type A sorting domain-containing protein [Chitinophagaceae bacterium]
MNQNSVTQSENSIVNVPQSTVRQFLMASLIPLLVITLVLLSSSVFAQYSINEITTDYNGFWKSGSGAVNPVKPDNSHNLLSFSYYGRRISTGVADSILQAKGLSFISGDYRALPVQSITGSVTSNTKIGVGEKYDGVSNGRGVTAIPNDIPYYLSDGVKGLDIGTCVANLPRGILNFGVSNIALTALNDSIPDVIITQTADPSGSDIDRYEFTDINGNRVGNYVDIVLNNIPSVGTWVADFYEASTNPMQLQSGFTRTERGLRLWAADFSVFGINASNIAQVAYFRIHLNGNSDVAFVAYNNRAINVNLVLPTELISFAGKAKADNTLLNWATASESNTDRFVVERSSDGSSFVTVASLRAKGNSNRVQQYTTTVDAIGGKAYYRLKMVDVDGKFTYSKVITIQAPAKQASISAFPNPAGSFTMITHPQVTGEEVITVYNLQGIPVKQAKATAASTKLEISGLAAGSYQVVFQSKTFRQGTSIIIQH